jgi:arylsulfatase A-like enzyme
VSCYGYGRLTTPNLDRLAAKGVRFANAFVQAPFTIASTASILTGVYPSVHRLQRYGQRLSDDLITLPEVLQEAGYYTAAFVANPHINPDSGLTRGFVYFTDGRPWYKRPRLMRHFVAWAESGKALNRCVKKQLERIGNQPWFFFVFYNDSHVPFSGLPHIFLPLVGRKFHTPDFERYTYTDAELARVIDLYDGSLRRADGWMGELWGLIQDTPYAGTTTFIISADHGEGLDRRAERAGHGRLYDNGIHIPLVVCADWIAERGRVIDEMVTSLDLAPTICELARLDKPAQFQGKSLVSFLVGETLSPLRSHIISEYHDSRCVRTLEWKLIQRGAGIGTSGTSRMGIELYDLAQDPGEEEDVSREHPGIVAELSRVLDRFASESDRAAREPSAFAEDELIIERLRGLGYVD